MVREDKDLASAWIDGRTNRADSLMAGPAVTRHRKRDGRLKLGPRKLASLRISYFSQLVLLRASEIFT